MSARFIRKSQPLGHRADGTPFWSYSGGAPDDEGGSGGNGDSGNDKDDEDSDDEEEDDSVGEDGLTAKGRHAIDAERKAAGRLKAAYKPWAALKKETGMSPEEILALVKGKKAPNKSASTKDDDSSDPVDVDEIRREANVQAQSRVNDKLKRAAVKAEAAEVLLHAGDAVRFLDLDDYEVDDDGEVDVAQIKRDLRALLVDRPELGKAAKKGGPRGGPADFDGGPRKTAASKANMSEQIREMAARRR